MNFLARLTLGTQPAVCPRVNRAKKFMCSPRNTGNINFSLWLTGGLSQGCADFQKVYVFKVYVPFSCPRFVCHILGSACHIFCRYQSDWEALIRTQVGIHTHTYAHPLPLQMLSVNSNLNPRGRQRDIDRHRLTV